MTPEQFRDARFRLGLTLAEMAHLLGFEGASPQSQLHHMETGKRTIRPCQIRLMIAYLEGYRPKDWPK